MEKFNNLFLEKFIRKIALKEIITFNDKQKMLQEELCKILYDIIYYLGYSDGRQNETLFSYEFANILPIQLRRNILNISELHKLEINQDHFDMKISKNKNMSDLVKYREKISYNLFYIINIIEKSISKSIFILLNMILERYDNITTNIKYKIE